MSTKDLKQKLLESKVLESVKGEKQLKCKIHKNQNIIKYCVPCKSPICEICIKKGPHNTSVILLCSKSKVYRSFLLI